MKNRDLFEKMISVEASDLHLAVGLPPIMRVCGALKILDTEKLTQEKIIEILKDVLPPERTSITPGVDIDVGIEVKGVARFRVNIYHDYNGIAAAFRLIPLAITPLEQLDLPPAVPTVCDKKKGLILVTGTTGSGKSTTLAAIIDKINSEQHTHIVTLEDPIEFLHPHKKSMVNQREVGVHVESFASGLRSALREDPNVILVGEMRDLDTIGMAITAAETGHLVLATLHTRSAAESIDRMIDVFPSEQQAQIRLQLSNALEMVVSQILIPSCDETRRHLACEVMVVHSAIRHLIRDKKTHQIQSAIETGSQYGMQTLNASLESLVNSGRILKEVAQKWSSATSFR